MWHSLFLIALPRDGGFVLLSYHLSSLLGLDGVAAAHLAAQLVSLAGTAFIARGAGRERRNG
jgi:hypothetical protein